MFRIFLYTLSVAFEGLHHLYIYSQPVLDTVVHLVNLQWTHTLQNQVFEI